MKRIQLEYLFEDRPVVPGVDIADYDAIDVVSHGSHIYGEVMWPDGGYPENRPCVVLLHGYPGTARNDDLAHALRRVGCVVVVPHHRGAWGSQGKYLISHCVEDAIVMAEYVRSEEFCRQFKVDPNCIFLGGHSMGGNSTINACRVLPWLKGLILLTPFDPTRPLRQGKIDLFKELLDVGYSLQWDGAEAVYQDAVDHVEDYCFEKAFPAVKDQNICCIEGSMDLLASREDMIQPLWDMLEAHETTAIQRLVEFPANHGLCTSRVQLIQFVGQFVADVVNGSDEEKNQ